VTVRSLRRSLILALLAIATWAPLALAQVADMGVTKSGPASAGPDSDVVYTIVVTNGGGDAAADVAVNDTLPAR
jgi:uncharacterized repeat protein (TIGR01451 family)